MFSAQTWLLAQGHLAIVGQVGLGLAVLSLALWTADWGGTLVLSRHAATENTIEYVEGAIAARLCISSIIVAVTVVFGLSGVDAPLSEGIIIGGATAAIVWAGNLSGYLDGHGKSAVSGPLSGLCWLAASVGLLLIDIDRPFRSGLIIGLLFTAGAAATILGQQIMLRVLGRPVGLRMTSLRYMRDFVRDGALYCLADLPGQFYARSIILMVAAFLGADTAGIYVYVRQITVAATQGISFILRVEFPAVARSLKSGTKGLRENILLQLWSIAASLSAVLLITGAAAILSSLPEFHAVPAYLIAFSILVPGWTVAAVLGQILIASGAMRTYAAVPFTAVTLALLAMPPSIQRFGLPAVVVIEGGMYLLMSVGLALGYNSCEAWSRRRKEEYGDKS